MDDEAAVAAVLVAPQLTRFRQVCEVDGPIQPRFDGYTKHVLLAGDRAFLFPRNHTIVDQIERECAVYATVDHPVVPNLLGRWHEPNISPYPFFAVTRLAGSTPDQVPPKNVPALASQLGAAIAVCHETSMDLVPRSLWANAWEEPPAAPPTAVDCYSPLRGLGGAEHLAESAASFIEVRSPRDVVGGAQGCGGDGTRPCPRRPPRRTAPRRRIRHPDRDSRLGIRRGLVSSRRLHGSE